VGDNLAKDFVAPNALGWTSILIDRPSHRHLRIHKHTSAPAGGAPHETVQNLTELIRLLG
jgi:putative hydrolase of the HAD superfamily